jgi:apolipoprotein N-acyltransferase
VSAGDENRITVAVVAMMIDRMMGFSHEGVRRPVRLKVTPSTYASESAGNGSTWPTSAVIIRRSPRRETGAKLTQYAQYEVFSS